ncbi:MAG TPA: hypothetical protein VN706_05085 [Gemmatimonadaceae bacterium]|nr:hypothetical protein [Gemmatimonadaceae bacterium]
MLNLAIWTKIAMVVECLGVIQLAWSTSKRRRRLIDHATYRYQTLGSLAVVVATWGVVLPGGWRVASASAGALLAWMGVVVMQRGTRANRARSESH